MSDLLPELITFHDLREHYRIPRTTAYRWMKSVGFPRPIQLTSKCVRFKRAEVDAWIKARPPAKVHNTGYVNGGVV